MKFTLAERMRSGIYPGNFFGWACSFVHFLLIVFYVGIKKITVASEVYNGN